MDQIIRAIESKRASVTSIALAEGLSTLEKAIRDKTNALNELSSTPTEALSAKNNIELCEWTDSVTHMVSELLAKWGDIDDFSALLERARAITSLINATEFGKSIDMRTYAYARWFPTMRLTSLPCPEGELLCWRRDAQASPHIMANPTISDLVYGVYEVDRQWDRRAARSGMENQLLECALGYIYATLPTSGALSLFDLELITQLVKRREMKRKSAFNLSTKYIQKGFAAELIFPDARPILVPSFTLKSCCSPVAGIRSSIQNTITLALTMLTTTPPCYPGIRCVKLPVMHTTFDEVVLVWRQADIVLDTTVFKANRVLFVHMNGPRVCYQISYATPVCDGLCNARITDAETVLIPYVECAQRRSRAGTNIGGSVAVMAVLRTREMVYVTAHNFSTSAVGHMFRALRLAVGKHPDYARIKLLPWRFFHDKVNGRMLLDAYYIDRDRTVQLPDKELFVANKTGVAPHVDWIEHAGSKRGAYISSEFDSILANIAHPYSDTGLADMMLPQIIKDADHDTWYTNNPIGFPCELRDGECFPVYDYGTFCTHAAMAFSVFPYKLETHYYAQRHYEGYCATILGGMNESGHVIGQMCLFVETKGYRASEFTGKPTEIVVDYSSLLEKDNQTIVLRTADDIRCESRKLRDLFAFAIAELSSRLQSAHVTSISLVPINKRRVSDSDI